MPRFLSSYLIAVAGSPFVAAVIASVLPESPCELDAAPSRPALAFDQYAVDFREVPLRPVIQAHFDFTNRSDQPVNITQLEPSCGCLDPKLYGNQTHYEPGERGRFYVTLHTANESPGLHDYTITLRYRDEQPREETLAFRLTLPERKVSVEPPEVYFYQLSGEPAEQVIYVTDYRDSGLEVVSARCTSDLVSVEVLPPESDSEGHRRTPIRLSVPGIVPAGRNTALVTIATTGPDFRELYAAVLVHGPSTIQPVGFDRGADEAD
jgi:hypothetical protein